MSNTTPKKAWGQNTDLALAILAEHGGRMASADLQAEMAIDKTSFSKLMGMLCAKSERLGQRVHIVDWTRESDVHGLRRYPRPVYKLGPGKNKPRPPRDDNRSKREWWARQRDKLMAANPFAVYASQVMRKGWAPKGERA